MFAVSPLKNVLAVSFYIKIKKIIIFFAHPKYF